MSVFVQIDKITEKSLLFPDNAVEKGWKKPTKQQNFAPNPLALAHITASNHEM